MAVEHAPKTRRGIFGASPQMGVPLGLLLASGMLALMATIAPGEAFLQWGWRVPFLLSFVLIVIGYYIRRRVEESPVFAELAERKEETRMPIVALFRKHTLLVVIAALVFAGNNAVGYMTTGGYIQRYATDPRARSASPPPTCWARSPSRRSPGSCSRSSPAGSRIASDGARPTSSAGWPSWPASSCSFRSSTPARSSC